MYMMSSKNWKVEQKMLYLINHLTAEHKHIFSQDLRNKILRAWLEMRLTLIFSITNK